MILKKRKRYPYCLYSRYLSLKGDKIMKKKIWMKVTTCLLVCSLALTGCSDKEVSDQINDAVEEGGKQLTNVDDKIRNITDAQDEYVQMVKTAYVMGQPKLTYGAAFDELFSSPTWKHFTSSDNKEVVEFTGRCIYNDDKIKVRMQFLIDDDGKNFEPYAMKCNDMTSNTLTMAAILYRVFDSYIDKHNLTVEDDEDSYFDSVDNSNSSMEEQEEQTQDSNDTDSVGSDDASDADVDTDTSDIYDSYDPGEYIFPDSDTQKLTKADLKGLSKKQLRIGRNEIYARHGRKFKDSELQSYFDSKQWYEGTTDPDDFSEDVLSPIEKKNAAFIQKFE